MKILHMCESLARGGGIASFVSNLTYSQSEVYDVTIGLVNQMPYKSWVDISSNIKVVEFGKSRVGFSVKYPIYIYNYIRKSKFDIVHIHSSFLYYALAVLFLHNSIKFVYTVHSDAVQENSSRWDRVFFWLKKMCFRLGWMHPVTISKASKESFDKLYGMDSKLIVNGVKRINASCRSSVLDRYRYTANTKIFYHPGRISEAKNQVMLCEAVHHLILSGEDVVLIISGIKQDISIYNQLENFFSDRIVYIGERSDVLDLLCEADAMCLSSKWEGMPIVLLEALSVGCIPVCTPVGGISEIIQDGYNGLLSSSGSLDDYIDALYRYIRLSNEDTTKMRALAKDTFDEYTIEKCSLNYCQFYDSLLNGK
jgi:glycosyltransferase involved in cell wall biosynthesis